LHLPVLDHPRHFLDFGFSNDPTALVRFGELSGNIYADELIYETGLTNQDISRRMKSLGISRTEEVAIHKLMKSLIKEGKI